MEGNDIIMQVEVDLVSPGKFDQCLNFGLAVSVVQMTEIAVLVKPKEGRIAAGLQNLKMLQGRATGLFT